MGYALKTVAYLLNRILTKSVVSTPYEIWKGKKFDLKVVKIWTALIVSIGCKWIFKKKIGVVGKVKTYKARLMAKRFYDFIKNEDEPYMYKNVSRNDILIIGNDIGMLSTVKAWLSKYFSMKDLREASYIFEIRIYRNRFKMILGLSEFRYIDTIVKMFDIENFKRDLIPMRYEISLSRSMSLKTPKERIHMDMISYASTIGSIMYAMLCTRLDIAHILSHYKVIKCILKYLRKTNDLLLVYERSSLRVEGYTDLSFQSDVDDIKSNSGHVRNLLRYIKDKVASGLPLLASSGYPPSRTKPRRRVVVCVVDPDLVMGSFKSRGGKDKVVFVMGATGTGKSRLAVDVAIHFGGEIVNSDKMQVYDGLNVVTNKVTDEERMGVPHHLLGGLPPDADFSASDFRRAATLQVESIARRGRLPIVAGGSNSYIEELIEGAGREFRRRYECCFLWVDVQLPVLHKFVAERVDRMVERGLVEEVRGLFDPDVADYSRGVRRAIGVPEMDRYLRAEAAEADEATKARLLEAAIDEIKANTCKLTCCQLQKIHRLCTLVDATDVFRRAGKEVDEAWASLVAGPSVEIAAAREAQQFAAVNNKKGASLMNGAVGRDMMVKVASSLVGATNKNVPVIRCHTHFRLVGT
ncbi:Adenylate isopentenyltransferase 5, chloroplastic [Musa troglodytarum]|uniref:adenylate dimethylallyltransferase (ADP/ATP-dependent) n=1 Tax=Musa troglodytarum TaxID=320322 RepID=A0A9E7EXB9_9LILI|nr:Adenylate isopentenyltransferase 5, chloroplastic [Musa troglodytarum]